LEERGRATNKGYPDNRYLRFENGEPMLTPVEAAPGPEGLEPIGILDAFAGTEYWLNWTCRFGPSSGLQTKLKRTRDMIVNAYGRSPLQSPWSTGQSASADGMKRDPYPQNLMAEYHIRYGGDRGVGYYLVAGNHIALMSRWTTCGAISSSAPRHLLPAIPRPGPARAPPRRTPLHVAARRSPLCTGARTEAGTCKTGKSASRQRRFPVESGRPE
jgi:hypothetical protein